MKLYFRFIILLFLSSIATTVSSQDATHRVLSIPVTRNTISLKEAWTGGMNSPQFSSINLNNDALPDLFVFDRVGDKVLTYLNTGNGGDSTFVYTPKYEELFPADLNNWALIRDYNNDGIPDIFTHANLGNRVYKGSLPGGVLHFDIVSPTLMYNDGLNDINIWTSINDIPVFTDVNRDGDMDVLTYGVFGASVEYYENQTMEHSGDNHYNIDSFKYVVATYCWGNFQGSAFNNAITLNVPCPFKTGLQQEAQGSRDAGNTIFDFDFDNDHDVDLLNGSVGYNSLAFLQNCGDSSYANICASDSAFPACSVRIDMPTFPAAYRADINNDGFEDMLVAPNARDGARNIQNVMLYKNTNNVLCNFVYESDSFIVENQLDFGTEAKPVLFDFNGDGLLDIVVGNYGYFRPYQTYKSTISVYYNTGTATQPAFTEQASDYNNFSSLPNWVNMSPAFGDLDGDGLQDMLVGDTYGYVHFFKNSGGVVASFPTMTISQYSGIDVGLNAAPFIYDVNGDSLNDLLIGKKDGKISYFWNMGTKTNALFNKDSVNANFGGVNVTQVGYSDGSSQPFAWKDANGNLKLFCGSTRGIIAEYDLDVTKLRSGSFTRIDSNFLKHDVGTKATIAIGDLNNDGLLEYVIGNSRGGILIYSDSLWNPETELAVQETNTPSENHFTIYPNPSRNYFVCEMSTDSFVHPQVEVFNILGARMNADFQTNDRRIVVNTTELSSGFYVVKIVDAGKTYTSKVLIEK